MFCTLSPQNNNFIYVVIFQLNGSNEQKKLFKKPTNWTGGQKTQYIY